MRNRIISLMLFSANYIAAAEAGVIPTPKTKLQVINDGIISDVTRRNLRDMLLCQRHKEDKLAVVMTGELPISSAVNSLDILRDISSSRPVIFSHERYSPLAFTGRCDQDKFCRPIGKAATFVLFGALNGTNAFSETLRNLKKFVYWNSRAQFILLLFETHRYVEESISSFFRDCWQNRILYVLLIYIQNETGHSTVDETRVYSYNPFNQDNTSTIVRLSFESFKNIMGRRNRQFPYLERLRDLNGYPLRVSMFDHQPKSILKVTESGKVHGIGGEDGILLSALTQHMNFSLTVRVPRDIVDMSYRRPDGVVTGSTGDIVYNRADVSFNSRFLRYDYVNDVDFTYPHDNEGFCIIVPKARQIPEYLCLFLPFSSVLWIACGVSVMVTTTFWYLTEVKVKGSSSYTNALINTCAVFLAVPLRYHAFQKHGRIFFFTWMYVSTVLTTMYQSFLITALVVPKFYKDINTLQDFDESGLKLVMFPGIKESALLDTLSPLRVRLSKKTIITTENFSTCLSKLMRYRDRGCAFNKLSADWAARQEEYYVNGVPQLHVVGECLSWYVEAYEVSRESPFLPYFNMFISRAIESGLFQKWRAYVHSAATQKERYTFPAPNQRVILQLSHFQAAFFSLFIGFLVSILVFLWEIWLYAPSQRNFYIGIRKSEN
jgi:hypothetical protein